MAIKKFGEAPKNEAGDTRAHEHVKSLFDPTVNSAKENNDTARSLGRKVYSAGEDEVDDVDDLIRTIVGMDPNEAMSIVTDLVSTYDDVFNNPTNSLVKVFRGSLDEVFADPARAKEIMAMMSVVIQSYAAGNRKGRRK